MGETSPPWATTQSAHFPISPALAHLSLLRYAGPIRVTCVLTCGPLRPTLSSPTSAGAGNKSLPGGSHCQGHPQPRDGYKCWHRNKARDQIRRRDRLLVVVTNFVGALGVENIYTSLLCLLLLKRAKRCAPSLRHCRPCR
jgi:hypothetical protein